MAFQIKKNPELIAICGTGSGWNLLPFQSDHTIYCLNDYVRIEKYQVQPDILFISNKRLDIIKDAAIMGSPDLIIEIVSPSSASYDTIEKRDVYEKYGVKEYWLVFPQEKAVEVLAIEKGIYKEFCKARKTGIVKSNVIEGITVEIKEIFEG